MGRALDAFGILLAAGLIAAMAWPVPPDPGCTPLSIIKVRIGEITLSIPSEMDPNIELIDRKIKIRKKRTPMGEYFCQEQSENPIRAHSVHISRYSDCSYFSKNGMPAIHLSYDYHADKEFGYFDGQKYGPEMFGKHTIHYEIGPLWTPNGRTTLYKIIKKYKGTILTFNMDTRENPDPAPFVRIAEDMIKQMENPS